MVLPPGYSLWWFFYKPFMWCRSDARLRHYYSAFSAPGVFQTLVWHLYYYSAFSARGVFQTLVRHQYYYPANFRSRRHSDPRLAPSILLWIILTTRVRHGFSYLFVTVVWSHINLEHVDIYYTRVLDVCEYIPTYSLACPWLLSWPDPSLGDEHRGDSLGTYVLT